MYPRKMTESEPAVLVGNKVNDRHSKIILRPPEFTIGRSKTASYNICNIHVSKTHCIFRKTGQVWTICDKSSFGTLLNNVNLEKDRPTALKDGDKIEFGMKDFSYIFYTADNSEPSRKKSKLNVDSDIYGDLLHSQQRLQNETEIMNKYMEEKNEKIEVMLNASQKMTVELVKTETNCGITKSGTSPGKLLHEKQLLEEKLREMQTMLDKKEKDQELLNKKLAEKEEQRLRELKELQEQKDVQAKLMLEELRQEVAEREEVVKIQLAREIQILQKEKLKIENDIKGELSKKEGESAENLKQLQNELGKVKKELINTEGKKQFLEKELEQTTKAKEDASESCLRAKQDVLHSFGDLMETELQCSICNELFVTATTLNCTHTFCRSCITQWKKKKKDCPVCRTRITSENRSIVLDNFIDRMVDNLSTEMKNRRQEIVEERKVQELLGPKSKAEPQRQHGRRGRNTVPAGSAEDRSQTSNEVIVVHGSESSSDTESETSDSYSAYVSDEDYIEGDPDAYYGGYGYCYRCGRRGHWARGCPEWS